MFSKHFLSSIHHSNVTLNFFLFDYGGMCILSATESLRWEMIDIR
jgi:hypothetical protein